MKKFNTLISIAIVAMMISGAFVALAPVAVAKSSTTVADPDPIDLGYKIREQFADPNLLSQNGHTADEAAPGDYWVVGNVAKYYTGSYGSAYYTLGTGYMWFTMRTSGEHCEVWTANDMLFPTDDPRNQYTSRLTVTDEQAQYMTDEFDNNIYPTEASYFSDAPAIDGTNSYFESIGLPESRLFKTHDAGKVMIMVFNIVDDNYWDPTYPYYIVGFFSPTNDMYYDRNIIHIDVYDWANRTGGNTPNHARDYLIEGTIAHEYQHLLHNFLKPDDPTWINEGFSDYTEMLCGYGVPESHIAHYLFNPDNALTAWGDQGDINILADYGAAALFMIYMNDHFGGPSFFSKFMHDPIADIAGIEDVLKADGMWQWNFERVFNAFRLANIIRSDNPGNGLYNYVSVDLDTIQGLSVNQFPSGGMVTRSEYLGPTQTMEGYDTGVSTVSAYSTDYYYVTSDQSFRTKILFQGDEKVYYNNWYIDETEAGYLWYSGTGIDLADQKLIAPISVDKAGSVFEFDTVWAFEEGWDFGFVQVSTDGGDTWTSLPYEYTTTEVDPNAISTVVENVPGVTGFSPGLVHISLDLSAYADQDILLSFRYVTDWGYTEPGWWVGNFVLDGEALPLEYFTPQYEDVHYLTALYFPAQNGLPARVNTNLYRVDSEGNSYLAWFRGYSEAIFIVSPDNGPVDYQLGMEPSVGVA